MKILLVEDERPLAEVIRRGLTREGFSVDVLHDGQEAVWAATETGYDVVVLDIMLPGMNGYEVVERLRAREVLTPVLMLTALDDEYDQANAFDLGADDYLTKPFSFVVLAARLRALVRRGGQDRVSALTVGDLHLDPTTRRVHRGPHEVTLTTREFALLHYLMERPDQVISKADILDGVWDPDFAGDVNIVEVYVGYLRKKVDVPFGLETIQTIRGAGYRLSVR
ncbi:response regulator transcription factor [Dermatophilaceae bacterium Soc4.6]